MNTEKLPKTSKVVIQLALTADSDRFENVAGIVGAGINKTTRTFSNSEKKKHLKKKKI